MNRRMRNRMYGGVRGRRGQSRPLLDVLLLVGKNGLNVRADILFGGLKKRSDF